MNHDFLLPLYPVHSEAFHTLGPVSEDMTFEELEGAQRDILGTLEFDVYDVTPQVTIVLLGGHLAENWTDRLSGIAPHA